MSRPKINRGSASRLKAAMLAIPAKNFWMSISCIGMSNGSASLYIIYMSPLTGQGLVIFGSKGPQKGLSGREEIPFEKKVFARLSRNPQLAACISEQGCLWEHEVNQ